VRRARYPISGKAVLVTGAARGIGAECARRLSERGARVALVGLEPELLEREAARCGPEAAWFEADVRDPAAVERAVAGTADRFGGIDVAIANAGIAAGGPFRVTGAEDWERVIEINLLGAVRTIRACLPHVVERRGYLLQIASLAAALHTPGMSAYAAAKAGVEAFADALRGEVEHLGVRVGVAYFAFVDTEIVAGAARTNPAFVAAVERQPAPLVKTYPLSAVGDAVVRGVERRGRWVVVPRLAVTLLVVRGLLPPIVDRGVRRNGAELIRLAEQAAEERGPDAGAPVGAGGEAALRSE